MNPSKEEGNSKVLIGWCLSGWPAAFQFLRANVQRVIQSQLMYDVTTFKTVEHPKLLRRHHFHSTTYYIFVISFKHQFSIKANESNHKINHFSTIFQPLCENGLRLYSPVALLEL